MNLHNKEKDYYEYLAKLLLERFLPDQYVNLKHADKPDLLMGDYHGIEVTRAILPGEGQASGIIKQLKTKRSKEDLSKSIKTKEGIEYSLLVSDEHIYSYYRETATWVSNQELKTSFLKKIKKASNYEGIQTVDLFIFSPMPDWCEKDRVLDFMKWADKSNNNHYSSIIVYEEKYIYVYNINNKQFRIVPTDESIVDDCCVKAKEYALNR